MHHIWYVPPLGLLFADVFRISDPYIPLQMYFVYLKVA